jgi:hypothetical protein
MKCVFNTEGARENSVENAVGMKRNFLQIDETARLYLVAGIKTVAGIGVITRT